MSFQAMNWFHGDHLRDCGHLTHEQSWSYFLLINSYWARGGLPDDDQQLAAIAGLSLPKWRKMKPVIQPFFRDGWRHKRIDHELEQAARRSDKARRGAGARWKDDAASDTF
jgi:uncharacterized protein YdaU (DUF1376 family)